MTIKTRLLSTTFFFLLLSCSSNQLYQKKKAEIQVSSTNLNFGEVSIGETIEKVLIVTNKGDFQVDIHENNSCIEGFNIVDSSCYYVEPKGTCLIKIQFQPEDAKSYFCDMSISDSKGSTKQVSLDGIGLK